MTAFQYHPDIIERFPAIVGGVIVGKGLSASSVDAELMHEYLAEQRAVLSHVDDGGLSKLEPLAAWRQAFRRFGVEPTQYRSAAESLLRRLTKKGDIPSINLLVDIGNLVSIRYALPVAVIDRQAVQLPITVHFARGDERFVRLGEEDSDPIPPGEVIFTDAAGSVVARRWCWRQSAESAATPSTTDVIVTVEAHHAAGRTDVERACADLVELFSRYAGGKYASSMLHVGNLAG
jgi:DNA/RNA-binding domain of Phe-tRNA-synthetase-like protein